MAALLKKQENLKVGSSSSSSRSSVCQGRSKAQMCLKRIVDFISSHSSSNRSLVHIDFDSEAKVGKQKETDMGTCGKQGGFDIDLNLRLGLCLESENEEKESSAACSGVGSLAFGGDVSAVDDKSSEGECDPKSKKKERSLLELGDETKESSEITNIQLEQTSSETKTASEGYLDLLVEAARLISGDFEEDDNDVPVPPSRTGKEKIHEEWMLDCYFEDISPVVRSKRGRNQVLPHRYRDSVLEPWRKRATKQRSSRVSGGKHSNLIL